MAVGRVERRHRPWGDRERIEGGRINRRDGRRAARRESRCAPRRRVRRPPAPILRLAHEARHATRRTRARTSIDGVLGGRLLGADRAAGVRRVREGRGIPGVPNAAASAAQRSRHAAGVAAGTSRCAPASQISAHVRGTTR